MWISREEYNSLLERISRLESAQSVRYGRFMCLSGPFGEYRWHAHDMPCTGDITSVNELVARIAQYLGFRVASPTVGGLQDPPKLWVDIHDRTPEPPKTIRLRTDNKLRNKQEK